MKSVLFYGRPAPEPPDKINQVIKAAKTVVRVSIYRTMAIRALGEALDRQEGKS